MHKRFAHFIFVILCFQLISCGSSGGSASPDISPQTKGMVSSARLVENNDLFSAQSVALDVNNTGVVVVVWTYLTNIVNSEIWANVYFPQSGWIGEQQLSGEISSLNIQVAVSEENDAVVIWSSLNEGIWSSRFINGTWQPSEQVSVNGVSPRLAKDHSDISDAVMTWSTNSREIYISKLVTDTGWTGAEKVPTKLPTESTSFDVFNPSIGADKKGNIYVTWWSLDGFRQNIFEQNSGWLGPSLIGKTMVRNAILSVSSEGQAVLVWKEISGVDSNLHTSIYETGNWSIPKISHSFTGLIFNPITAQIDDKGKIWLVWDVITGNENLSTQVKSIHYKFDNGWSDQVEVLSDKIGSEQISNSTFGRNNDPITVWGSTSGIYGSISNQNEKRDTILLIDEPGQKPLLAYSDDSTLLIWLQKSEGGKNNIWYSTWDI